ncbi:MAG: MATE family efflux transporter [Spirochaetales bacterium]|nr:MATE family efflux transporter [Spirochaetales bacterium]
MIDSKELLEGSPSFLLRRLAVPAATGLVFNTFFNITDLLYASRYSLDALSGLTLASSIFFMLISISVGLGSGLSVLMSNSRGEGRNADVKILFVNGLLIAIFLTVLILSFFFPFIDDLVLLFTGDKSSGILEAEEYLRVIVWGFFFFMFNGILNSVLASSGDTKTYRNFLMAGFLINIILNYFFMYGVGGFEGLGVAGVALSTVLIQVIGSCFLLVKVAQSGVFGQRVKFSLVSFSSLKKIILFGLPVFINLMSISLFQILIQFFLYRDSLSGQAIAGYGAGTRVEQIVLLPFLGLSTAVVLATSTCFGAKRFARIKEFVISAFQDSFLLMIILFVPVIIFRKDLALFFTNDEVSAGIAVVYIFFSFIGFYFNFIALILATVLHSLKRPLSAAIIYFANNLFLPFVIVFIFWVFNHTDIYYLFAGLAIGKVISGLISIICLKVVFVSLDKLEEGL